MNSRKTNKNKQDNNCMFPSSSATSITSDPLGSREAAAAVASAQKQRDDDDLVRSQESSGSSSSGSDDDDDDDDLVLDGALVRNPDASSSSSEDDEEDDDGGEDDDNEKQSPTKTRSRAENEEASSKPAAGAAARGMIPSKRRAENLYSDETQQLLHQSRTGRRDDGNKKNKVVKKQSKKKKKKNKKKSNEPDVLQVEFIFCDMTEKYMEGISSLLNNSSTVYQRHARSAAGLIADQVAVGTVVSQEDDDVVFGFASVINVVAPQRKQQQQEEESVVRYLKEYCLAECPSQHEDELRAALLSGKTRRSVGFLLHGRMMNLPLQIVLALHQQLVLDLDWAAKQHAGEEGDDDSGPKSSQYDFGAFIRLAPCSKDGNGGGGSPSTAPVFRYFEDEVFCGRAEFDFMVEAPKSYSREEKQYLTVMVLTKKGHAAAMEDLAKLCCA